MSQSTKAPTRRRSRRPRKLALLGPAFVAGIAYVDPGNVATNTTAGVRYGYLLLWVIVLANAMAILVQFLSAKLGVATGSSLAHLCRERYGKPTRLLLFGQAEAVAIATDLAEVLGGAIALALLFDLPLLAGGVVTASVSMLILVVQGKGHQRAFERITGGLLAVIGFGFAWCVAATTVDVPAALGGLSPSFAGTDSILLAAGMLGATVMPHAIYVHSALVVDRFGTKLDSDERRNILAATRVDVLLAMFVAGAVNAAMLLMAAGALRGSGAVSIEQVYEGLGVALGAIAATLFAIALLASGLSSSSVGTYAGAVILDGFMRRRIPAHVLRLVTLVPALTLLAVGVDPTQALVISQVVLSFGIPFALVPLILLTRDRKLMGELANGRAMNAAACVVTTLVVLLNGALIVLTFA